MADPRYRPFRVAAYAVYLVFVVGFCALVLIGVTRSVIAMNPSRPAAVGPQLSPRECTHRAVGLWDTLEQQRKQLTQAAHVLGSDQRWTDFRTTWLAELRDDEALCAVDRPGRQELQRVFRQLEHVEDLYTTSAVQFAGEIGPSIDKLRTQLRALEGAGRPAR